MARPTLGDKPLTAAERTKRARLKKKMLFTASLLRAPSGAQEPEPEPSSLPLIDQAAIVRQNLARARAILTENKEKTKMGFSKLFEDFMIAEIDVMNKTTEQMEKKARFLAILEAQADMAIIGGQNAAAVNLLDRLMGKVTDSLKLSGDSQEPVSIQSVQMMLVAPNESIAEPMAEVATTEPLDTPETVFEEVVEEPKPEPEVITFHQFMPRFI